MDIQHDRAGFYFVWGCMVWVPTVYTASVFWLTNNRIDMGVWAAVAVGVAGLFCIFINYDIDRQRVEFRKTDGQARIWGRKAESIRAEYSTEDGSCKTSLLLCSGYWGLSRHLHYIPEILAAMCWSLPAGLTSVVPYCYVVHLTVLLVHRSYRDDARCGSKYGKFWEQYCERVPARIIPGVF